MSTSKPTGLRRFQFGLGSILLLMALIALALVVVQERNRSARLEAEIVALRGEVNSLAATVTAHRAQLIDQTAWWQQQLLRQKMSPGDGSEQGQTKLLEPYRPSR